MSLNRYNSILIIFLTLFSFGVFPKIKDFKNVIKFEQKNGDITSFFYFDPNTCATEFSHKDIFVKEFEELNGNIWYLLSFNKNAKSLEKFRKLMDEELLPIKIKDERISKKLKEFQRKKIPDAYGNFYLGLMAEKFDLASHHTFLYHEALKEIKLEEVKRDFQNITLKNDEIKNQSTHFLLENHNLHPKIKKIALSKIASSDKVSDTLLAIEKGLPRVIEITSFSNRILSGFTTCAKNELTKRDEISRKPEFQGSSIEEQEFSPVNTIYY